MLIIEGKIRVNNDTDVLTDNFVLMANDGEKFSVKATEDAIVLVLSGEPIDEPIAAHGPFDMNTRQEYYKLSTNFNKGKFGHLEE